MDSINTVRTGYPFMRRLVRGYWSVFFAGTSTQIWWITITLQAHFLFSRVLRQFATFPFLYFVWIMLWWLSDITLDLSELSSTLPIPYLLPPQVSCYSSRYWNGSFCWRTAWMRIGGNLICWLQDGQRRKQDQEASPLFGVDKQPRSVIWAWLSTCWN